MFDMIDYKVSLLHGIVGRMKTNGIAFIKGALTCCVGREKLINNNKNNTK